MYITQGNQNLQTLDETRYKHYNSDKLVLDTLNFSQFDKNVICFIVFYTFRFSQTYTNLEPNSIHWYQHTFKWQYHVASWSGVSPTWSDTEGLHWCSMSNCTISWYPPIAAQCTAFLFISSSLPTYILTWIYAYKTRLSGKRDKVKTLIV